jgi:hypothetical protein
MMEGVNLIKIFCRAYVNVAMYLPVQVSYANKKESKQK